MSDRLVRAAEWSAFASMLSERAINLKRDARATKSDELALMALVLLAISADATKLAVAIRFGEPPEPAPDQGAS